MMKNLEILFSFAFFPFLFISQQTNENLLQNIPGISVRKTENKGFKEFYEISLKQLLDHFDSTAGFFNQRIFSKTNRICDQRPCQC